MNLITPFTAVVLSAALVAGSASGRGGGSSEQHAHTAHGVSEVSFELSGGRRAKLLSVRFSLATDPGRVSVRMTADGRWHTCHGVGGRRWECPVSDTSPGAGLAQSDNLQVAMSG